MAKILWLDLNSSYSHSSLALPALHAQLGGDAGWEWSVVRATINEDPGDAAAKIYAEYPDVIAATCWLFTHEHLMAVLSRTSQLLPEAMIILGGPEFLDDNEHFLRTNDFVTAVFRGEGEISVPAWLKCWNDRSHWHEVPGICWLEGEDYRDMGLAKSTNSKEKANDFNQLHLPEESRFFSWDKAFVQLETCRGCFNTCKFCVSGGEKPVRVLPMETVRQRVADIHAHGIRDVRMLDRTFNYDQKRATEMLELFKSYYPEMHFHLEVHPALMTDVLKAELAKMPAGLLHVEAGIQSLHQDVLDTCGRKGSLEASLEGLKYLASLPNLVVHADLIAGLPLYHLDQIFEDVKELASYRIGEIQLESLKILPGTRMKAEAEQLGLRYSPQPPYEVLMTNEMSPEEMKRAMHLSRMLDFYYNTEAWQNVFRDLMLSGATVEGKEFMEAFLDHLISLSVISTPLSLERRGVILLEFCRKHLPEFTYAITAAWVEAGISLKKVPGDPVFRIKYLQRFIEEEEAEARLKVIYGQEWLPGDVLPGHSGKADSAEATTWTRALAPEEAKTLSEKLRIYCLRDADGRPTLFGFNSEQHQPSPVFRAELA